jgi:hypothetical protein
MRWPRWLGPLAGAFLGWLPGQSYPVRYTARSSAFGLSLVWPFAEARAGGGDPALRDAIAARALAWFSTDTMYPADWEPSGDDCVSPALTEAELMARVLPTPEFADWLSMFLPGLEWGRPGTLFTPAVAGDPAGDEEGQEPGGRFHGLNPTRSCCWRQTGRPCPRVTQSEPARPPPAARQSGAALMCWAVTTSWSTGWRLRRAHAKS